MRGLLWERGKDEIGPTALYLLTVEPLLHPPVAALEDEVRMRTICNHPELFKIVCDIDVDALKNLLRDHPNLLSNPI